MNAFVNRRASLKPQDIAILEMVVERAALLALSDDHSKSHSAERLPYKSVEDLQYVGVQQCIPLLPNTVNHHQVSLLAVLAFDG